MNSIIAQCETIRCAKCGYVFIRAIPEDCPPFGMSFPVKCPKCGGSMQTSSGWLLKKIFGKIFGE
jgi:ribosomal protein S27E